MVDKEEAEIMAKQAIEDYLNNCEIRNLAGLYEAAAIMLNMAQNLIQTITDPATAITYEEYRAKTTH